MASREILKRSAETTVNGLRSFSEVEDDDTLF
jgi:hypothetical protein